MSTPSRRAISDGGIASAVTVARWSVATISFGVFAGATRPCHVWRRSLDASSSTVAISAAPRALERRHREPALAVRMCGTTDAAVANYLHVAAITSCKAGAPL